MNNIYLLGGEGFLGKNISEYFLNFTDFNVYSIARRESVFKFDNNPKFHYIMEDVYDCKFNLEKESVIVCLARGKFNGYNELKESEKQLKRYVQSFDPKIVIVFSSAVMYVDGDTDYKEEKSIIESVWDGPKTCILRLFNTFGKYQLPFSPGGLVSTIFYNQLTGKKTNINDINQVRNYIYAGDIGKVLLEIINKHLEGVIDVGGKSTITIEELINSIKKVVDIDSINILKNDEELFLKDPNNVFDIEYTSLDVGLQKSFKFLKDNVTKING